MARRGSTNPFGWLSGFWTRISLLLLILLAAGLLFAHKQTDQSSALNGLRTGSDDLASPVMQLVDLPLSGGRRGFDWLTSYWNSAARVRQLEVENRNLRQWESLSHALHGKVLRYEQLLNMKGEVEIQSISTRLVAETRGPFVRSALLRAGRRDGVAIGQAVVAPDGMVGRIVRAGNNSSRVLLLNDLNSRIPVRFAGTGARAILAGDNGQYPTLIYITKNFVPVPGTRISTSGDDGVLPSGIAIGEVMETATEEPLRVRMFANLGTVDFVQVFGNQPIIRPEDESVGTETSETVTATRAEEGTP